MRERERRKVLLLLDNFSGHYCDIELKNITIIFLPEKTTSKTQPMDAGIIRAFKAINTSLLNKRLIEAADYVENSEQFVKTITILDAIKMIVKSWDLVKRETIVNSWSHVWFTRQNNQPLRVDDVDGVDG